MLDNYPNVHIDNKINKCTLNSYKSSRFSEKNFLYLYNEAYNNITIFICYWHKL